MKDSNKLNVQSIFLFLILLLMFVAVITLFFPYMEALFWSVVLYILVSPFYKNIVGKLDKGSKFYEKKRRAIAGLFSVGTVLIVTGIVLLIVILAIGQAIQLGNSLSSFMEIVQEKIEGGFFDDLANSVYSLSKGKIDLRNINLSEEVMAFFSEYTNDALKFLRSIITNTGNFILTLLFICFTLYFLYVDGAYLAGLLIKSIPIQGEDTKKILEKFQYSTTNMFKGFFLVAIYQAIAALVIFLIFRVKGAIVLSILILFSSFIPFFGAGMIWGPVGVAMFFTGSKIRALLFLLISGLGISMIDNFLRPAFLKDQIQIHPLLIFFSILGGVGLMGIKGLLLGPMTLIIFFTVIDIVLDPKIQTDVVISSD